MPHDPVPELLARATEVLEAEFGALPEFEAGVGRGAQMIWLRFSTRRRTGWAITIRISILFMPGRC